MEKFSALLNLCKENDGHWGKSIIHRNFADNIFKCILWNENVQISIKISLFLSLIGKKSWWLSPPPKKKKNHRNIDVLVQDCSNSIANVLELLQSCTKP